MSSTIDLESMDGVKLVIDARPYGARLDVRYKSLNGLKSISLALTRSEIEGLIIALNTFVE